MYIDLSKINWSKINDFLLSLSAEQSINGLNTKIFSGLPNLIGFENSMVLIELKDNNKASIKKSLNMGKNWENSFDGYYYKIGTFPNMYKNILSANYNNSSVYAKNEYVNDFIYPQRIIFSAGFLISGRENSPSHCLVLNRSKSENMFNREEFTVLKVIQPFISSFYKASILVEELLRMPFRKIEFQIDNKLLSIRESEIVFLLSKRLKPKDIAVNLKISIRTVRKHIENIYEKLNVADRQELFQKINLT